MPVVTMSEMVAALRATVGKRGMPEEDLRALADYLMSFFGFETEAIDNNLDVADRDVFYMLEEEGLLTTRQEEVMLKKGKMWRIHYWILRVERIKAFAKPQRSKAEVNAFAVYNALTDDIWARRASTRSSRWDMGSSAWPSRSSSTSFLTASCPASRTSRSGPSA